MSERPLFIAIPAWGEYYVDLAVRFTVPAVIAALQSFNPDLVTFIIHTDDEVSFKKAIGAYRTNFMPVLKAAPAPRRPRARLDDSHWVAFKQAHKDALNVTPLGAICVLLNSDIVCSREAFVFASAEIEKGKKAVVSVGIRTTIEGNEGPPIGADAETLFKWIWGHRHHITEECIWGRGRSQHPTILFFDDGAGNVEMRGWHLTPMFVLKDRDVRFKGTIDDDMLGHYSDDEVSFMSDGQAAFAEISANAKGHPFGIPLSVDSVIRFNDRRGDRRFTRAHVRNFKQPMRVLGHPSTHPAIAEIIARLPT